MHGVAAQATQEPASMYYFDPVRAVFLGFIVIILSFYLQRNEETRHTCITHEEFATIFGMAGIMLIVLGFGKWMLEGLYDKLKGLFTIRIVKGVDVKVVEEGK